MAWGGKRSGRGGKGGNGATAGAFRTKTKGLYTAKFDGKWLKAAYQVFRQAVSDGTAVVVFIRRNERADGPRDPIFRVGLAVDQPFAGKRRIKEDPDDDPEMSDPEDGGDEGSEDAEEVNFE